MERKTFRDFYGDFDSDDENKASRANQATSTSSNTDGKGHGKQKGKKSKAKDKNSDGSITKSSETAAGLCSSAKTKYKTASAIGKGAAQSDDQFSKKDLPTAEEDIGTQLLASETFNKFFKAINIDESKASDSESKNYDLYYNGPKLPFVKDPMDRPVGKMNISHGNSTSIPVVHTEWAGGPDPRSYRFTHASASKMKDVRKTTEETKVKRTENDVLSAPSTVCGFCRKKDLSSLKRCARCVAVSYCSKECQRSHFNNHKLFCKRCERYDIARARVWPALRFYRDLHHDRDYTVSLEDLPDEDDYHLGQWCNILLEVVGGIFHLFRFGIDVTDLSGQKTRVFFYDSRNIYEHPEHGAYKPLPMTPQEDFTPGRFLLIMGAHWRCFLDGQVGIRINDLNSIYLIKMDDLDIPKEYRHRVV